MIFISSLLAGAHALNVSLADWSFQSAGSATNPSIGFDAGIDNFTLLWYPNGRETVTGLSAVGFAKDGTEWMMVKLETGSTTTVSIGTANTIAASDNRITFAFSDLSAAVVAASSSQAFNFVAGRVYPICVLTGVPKASSTIAFTEKGCGSYHTMATSSTFESTTLDRNLGNYQSSKTMASVGTATANTYNYTLYTSLEGNIASGKLNAGLVAWSIGTATAFNMWTRTEIGENTEKIDSMGQKVALAMGDYYQASSAITDNKLDTATGTVGCEDNVKNVSSGKSTVSGNLYQYAHYNRDLLATADPFCDNVVLTNSTKLCFAWLDGDTTLTDFAAAGNRQCSTFTGGQIVAVAWMAICLVLSLI